MLKFFATTAKGMEELLADELRALGSSAVAQQRAGVSFSGPLDIAYRACLWSRVASRVLLPVGSFPAETPDALYDGVRSIRWLDHLIPTQTLAVDFGASQSAISHSHYGALKTKDAIVDHPARELQASGWLMRGCLQVTEGHTLSIGPVALQDVATSADHRRCPVPPV